MKKMMIIMAMLLTGMTALAAKGSGGSVQVSGYTRKDGTYVAPHVRSAPDSDFNNNWSTKGNNNPYTGKEGERITHPSKDPYSPPKPSPDYGSAKKSGSEKSMN